MIKILIRYAKSWNFVLKKLIVFSKLSQIRTLPEISDPPNKLERPIGAGFFAQSGKMDTWWYEKK